MSYSFGGGANVRQADAEEVVANVTVKEPAFGLRGKQLTVQLNRDIAVAINYTAVEFEFEHAVGGIIAHRRQRRRHHTQALHAGFILP